MNLEEQSTTYHHELDDDRVEVAGGILPYMFEPEPAEKPVISDENKFHDDPELAYRIGNIHW